MNIMTRRTLLSFFAALLCCSSWAIEIPSELYSSLSAGRCFLYNVTQQKFLTGSPSMAESPAMLTLTATDEQYNISPSTGKYLKMGVSGSQYLWNNSWSDNEYFKWNLDATGTGTYRLSITVTTQKSEGGYTFTVGKHYLNTVNSVTTNAEEADEWALISQDAYITANGGLTLDNRSSIPATEAQYYLYDVMNKQFLRTDTRVLTTAPAALVTVTPTTGGFNLSGTSGKFLKIGVWKGQYLWSDGTEGNTIWTIEEADAQNVFYIYTNNFTETSSEVSGKTMYLTGTNASSSRPQWGQWALVTPAQYAAFRWKTYMDIAAQATDHSGFDNAVSAALASLGDNATEEDIEGLSSTVWEALCELLKNGTTPTGTFDLTPLIQNPSFDANASGWTSTKTLTWNAAGLAENYNHSSGNISQTLSSLPAGHYTMKVQAFYRSADYTTASSRYEQGCDNFTAEMYFGSTAQSIWNINDDARYVPIHPSSDAPGANGTSIPNSLGGANAAFAEGLYWNVLQADLTNDGDVTIGLRYSAGETYNWLPFDNFRLYYSSAATTPSVTLTDGEAFSINEDMQADVTLNHTFASETPTPLCLPFDVDAATASSTFSHVYTLGSVENGNSVTASLVPVSSLKAGRCYYVTTSGAQNSLIFRDVQLRAVKPDQMPVLWDGATQQGSYATSGYGFKLTLDNTSIIDAAEVSFAPVDFSNMQFTVNLENSSVRRYLDDVTYTESSASQIDGYNIAPPSRRDQPNVATIPLPAQVSVSTLYVSLNSDYSDATTWNIGAGHEQWQVANLLPQQTYYYKVENNGTVCTKGCFKTEGHLRMIKANSGSNIRDLGGWLNADGNRLRYGLIYRGGEMNGGHVMNDADRAELLRLGIGAELDLRYDSDINGYGITSSALGSEVPYTYLNINEYGDDALRDYSSQFKTAFGFMLENLRAGRPVFFHCIWGADRTGCYAMLLEGLLGLPVDQMYKDYELTSYSIAGTRHKSGLNSKLTYINALEGSSLQMRFFNYWNKQVGVSANDLLEFIDLMVDGTSSLVNIVEIDEEATDAPTPSELAKVTLQRTLKEDIWNTFCVPFDLSADRIAASALNGATIYGFSESTSHSISFEEVDHIEAGKPYLIKVDDEVKDPVFNGVTIASTDGISLGENGNVQFVGQMYNKSLSGVDNVCYLTTGGLVARLSATGGIKGLRAYFIVPETSAQVKLFFGDNETVIDEISNTSLSDGNWFDLSGRSITKPHKGLYISNGKKIIVR